MGIKLQLYKIIAAFLIDKELEITYSAAASIGIAI